MPAGPYADLRDPNVTSATINLESTIVDAIQNGILVKIIGTAHVHPSGVLQPKSAAGTTTIGERKEFDQKPSKVDEARATKYNAKWGTSIHLLIAAGDRKVIPYGVKPKPKPFTFKQLGITE